MIIPFKRASTAVLAAVLLSCSVSARAQFAASSDDLLPTLTPVESTLRDNDLVRDPNTQQVLLRFSNAIANVGAGRLHVVAYRDSASPATVDIDNDTMPAYQRVYRANGLFHDELIGQLIYHPEHHHFHFNGAARYRLIDPATGAVLMEAPKVSFCLADVTIVDNSLPGFSKSPYFNSCAHDPYATSVGMGVSVGWSDIYGKDLIGQAFDVTALMAKPAQWYELESTTNPSGLIWETNRSSPAVVRVLVKIGVGVPVGVGKSRPGV